MIVNKRLILRCQLRISEKMQKIMVVEKQTKVKCGREIRSLIRRATHAFHKMCKSWETVFRNIETVLKCYVISLFLYVMKCRIIPIGLM